MESAPEPPPEHPAGPLFAFAETRSSPERPDSGQTDPAPAEARPGIEAARPAPAWNERTLAAALAARVGQPIEVVFGRARSYPVQATREPDGSRRVRLHQFFREAPTEAVEDLAAWLRSGRRARAASARLDAYLEQSVLALGKREPPRQRVTRGQHHDLLALHRELLAERSAAPVHHLDPIPVISFGRFSSRKPRRRLLLGSYDSERHWVRIHPLVDHELVPAEFVRFLLYHELLHAALPTECDSAGRVRHHGPKFREAERAFAGTEPALAWERKNQPMLFRLARRGS